MSAPRPRTVSPARTVPQLRPTATEATGVGLIVSLGTAGVVAASVVAALMTVPVLAGLLDALGVW